VNLVGYVFLMLGLLTILAAAGLRNAQNSEAIHQALLTQCHVDRALLNADEDRLFTTYCSINLRPGPKKGGRKQKKTKGDRPKPSEQKQDDAPALTQDESEEEDVYLNSDAGDFLFTERLNLALISPLEPDHPQRRALVYLIDHLYGAQGFFSVDAAHLIDRVIETLQALPPDQSPSSEEELGSLDLAESDLRRIWIRLLKGRAGRYPPLLAYMTYDKKSDKKLQAFRLPPILWAALVDDSPTAAAITDRRSMILGRYAKQKGKKGPYEEEFKAFVSQLAPEAAWQEQLDYGLRPAAPHVLMGTDVAGAPIAAGHESEVLLPRLQQYLIR
jgi:hypothetical protein